MKSVNNGTLILKGRFTLNSKIMKLLAMVLAIAMIFSFAACGGNENPEETDAPSSQEAVSNEDDTTLAPDVTAEGTTEPVSEDDTTAPAEEPTEAQSENASASEESTDATASTQAGSTAASTQANSTAAKPTAAQNTMPKTTKEILDYYAKATGNAVYPKAGFHKERSSALKGEPDIPTLFKPFKGLVYGFMGIGEENKYTKTIVKGEEQRFAMLAKSKLTANDVKSATCKESNGNYIITIKLKDGSSYATKGNITDISKLPLEKSGICTGNKDKSEFDHKNAPVMYDALDDTFANAKINESYSNAVVTATVNAKTGRITALTVKFDISVNLAVGAVKFAVDGVSTVKYSNFKY